MKFTLALIFMIMLRCCWGPTEYQLMSDLDNNYPLPKELIGSYSINDLDFKDVSPFKLKITFNDSSKTISGFSGCNRFFGSFSLSESQISFSQMGSTKKLCDKSSNDIETELLQVFEKANILFFNEQGFSLFNDKKLLLRATKDASDDITKIEYSTFSRGSHQKIIIGSQRIQIENKKGSFSTNKTLDKYEFDKIMALASTLSLESLSDLKPPSQDHQFDGAALARLSITKDNIIYETESFDHGNPPPAIANLVKEMLSLAEKIE